MHICTITLLRCTCMCKLFVCIYTNGCVRRFYVETSKRKEISGCPLCVYYPQVLRTYHLNTDYPSQPHVLFPSHKAIFHGLRLLLHPTLISSVAGCPLFSYNCLLALSFFFDSPDEVVTPHHSGLFIGLFRRVLLLLSPKPML